jgi:ankyrin repeat protein
MWVRLNWFKKRRLNRDLLIAVSGGKTQQVEQLLDAGASANAEGQRRTALSIAGRSPWSNAATVRLLLERGALVNGDPKRRTEKPLVTASHQSDKERIWLLITNGADVNALQPGIGTGLTPLQELVRWADLETLSLLVERGADINKKCAVYEKRMSGGFTALHSAADAGRPDVVAFLLEKGGDITLSDAQGRSALDYARKTLDQPFFRDKRDEKWAETYRETKAEAYQETIALLEKETERCPNH